MAKILMLLCCVIVLTANASFASDKLVVIVNKENTNTVDLALIKKIYLGNASRWPSGAVVTAYNQGDESPITAAFANKVIGKSVGAIRDAWAQSIFTGKAMPPKVNSSDEGVKKQVSRSKNAIGYISASSLDDSVKAVYTVQ
jgi:ABC-type phosphate transport system substrate-binding protein